MKDKGTREERRRGERDAELDESSPRHDASTS